MQAMQIPQPAAPSTASNPSLSHLNLAEIDYLIGDMLKRFRHKVPACISHKAPFDEKDSEKQKMEYPTVEKPLDDDEEEFLLFSTHQLIASFLEKRAEEFEPELMLAAFSIAQKMVFDNCYRLKGLFSIQPAYEKKVMDLEWKFSDIIFFKTETITSQTPTLLEAPTVLSGISKEDLSEEEIAQMRDKLYLSLSKSLVNLKTKIDNPISLLPQQLENLQYAYDFALNLADQYTSETTSQTRISSRVASLDPIQQPSPTLTVIELGTPSSEQDSKELSTLEQASSPSLITPWATDTTIFKSNAAISSIWSSPLSPTRKEIRAQAEQQSSSKLVSIQTLSAIPAVSLTASSCCCLFQQKQSTVALAATQDPGLKL
ncbi:MAG: hypothetical protein WCW01_04755 [Gammaproteobacteria bacterium]